MSYLRTARRPTPQKPLSGLWGDTVDLFKEASSAIVDPIARLIPGTPAHDLQAAADKAKADRLAAEAARAKSAAAVVTQHGGVAPAPGISFTDAINSLKTMASSGRKERSNLAPALIVGAVAIGGFVWWRRRKS